MPRRFFFQPSSRVRGDFDGNGSLRSRKGSRSCRVRIDHRAGGCPGNRGTHHLWSGCKFAAISGERLSLRSQPGARCDSGIPKAKTVIRDTARASVLPFSYKLREAVEA